MSRRWPLLWISLTTLFAFLLLFLSHTPDAFLTSYSQRVWRTVLSKQLNEKAAKFSDRLQNSKNCLLLMLKQLTKIQQVWKNLHTAINECEKLHSSGIQYINVHSDKVFLPLRKTVTTNRQSNCVFLTLGVGAEIGVEKTVKDLYPHCQFYGVDPLNITGAAYRQLGKLWLTAVDEPPKPMKLFLQQKENWNSYTWATINTTSIERVWDWVPGKIVHFLSLDVEGSEYRLMKRPELFKIKDVCQISIELHGPLKSLGVNETDFENIFLEFLERSPFVPVKAYNPGNHHRFGLINNQSSACLKLFYQ